MRIRPEGLLALTGCVLSAACGGPTEDSGRTALAVFAASSLTEAFQDLEEAFEAEHLDVDVHLAFAGSQILRLQLEQGAEADVFASANQDHMQALSRAGLVEDSRTFTANELVIVVPADNPAGIASFEDLTRAQRLVIGTDNVPAGIYARRVLDAAAARFGRAFAADVRQRIVSEESNVRLVRAKVELGEADAAIVYRTDATAISDVAVVPIPQGLNVRATYPIGIVAGSERQALARRFVDFVLGEHGQRILTRHGFVGATP